MKFVAYLLRPVWLSVIALVVIVGCVGWWQLRRPSHTGETAGATTTQHKLQTQLTTALSNVNDQSIVDTSTQLIDGQRTGTITVKNTTLAMYYLERAASYSNLKQYAKAIQDDQQAAKLDNSLEEAALQGEVQAGYKAGERQQLVPLFQRLVKLAADDHDPLDPTPADYRQDIQNLQNNQPIEF